MSRCPTCGNTGHPARRCPRKGELTKKRAAIAMSGGDAPMNSEGTGAGAGPASDVRALRRGEADGGADWPRPLREEEGCALAEPSTDASESAAGVPAARRGVAVSAAGTSAHASVGHARRPVPTSLRMPLLRVGWR